MNQKIFLVIISIVTFFQNFAQSDAVFFNLNTINPAYVGVKDNLSVGVKYNTIFSGVDGSPKSYLLNTYTPISQKMGVGLSFSNYSIGPSTTKIVNVDYSYKFKLIELYV